MKAQDGSKAAYTMVAATTVGVVYMFSADGTHTGNLTTPYTASARADVDKILLTRPSSSSMSVAVAVPSVKNKRAFISINAGDAIKDFPAHYGIPANWPVKSYSGNQIAWTWADMLDGSINMKLEAAGIASTFWWSGSTSDGSYDTTNNCSGWTDGTNNPRAWKEPTTNFRETGFPGTPATATIRCRCSASGGSKDYLYFLVRDKAVGSSVTARLIHVILPSLPFTDS